MTDLDRQAIRNADTLVLLDEIGRLRDALKAAEQRATEAEDDAAELRNVLASDGKWAEYD